MKDHILLVHLVIAAKDAKPRERMVRERMVALKDHILRIHLVIAAADAKPREMMVV